MPIYLPTYALRKAQYYLEQIQVRRLGVEHIANGLIYVSHRQMLRSRRLVTHRQLAFRQCTRLPSTRHPRR